MTATTQPMSADDLWKLPANDLRHELVKGELRTMAPAGFQHGIVTMNLGTALAQHVKAHGLGLVPSSETGFVLRHAPDTVRAPDIAFVRAERIAAQGRPLKFWEGAPDLAVEVLSPSDTVDEVECKVDDYLTAGTLMVWVINPSRRSFTVHRPDQQPLLLRESGMLDGGDVVNGFSCPVAEIFR
jgi:Uma2 family endonuclease